MASEPRPSRRPDSSRPFASFTPAREGAFWILVILVLPRILGAIITVVLRRGVGPLASGLFDLTLVPYRLLDNFRAFGTGPALVFERTVDPAIANTAWTVNMVFAVIVTAIAQLLANPIAHYYGHPRIELILRLLSLAYVFASVGSVHAFLLLRDRDLRVRAIPPLGQVIVAGDIAILFAIWGFTVTALVVRELVSVALGTILLIAIVPYWPRLQLVPAIAFRLMRYGAWVGAGATLLYLSQNVDVLVGGHIIHNAADMGFYTTSWNLAFMVASVFAWIGSTVLFPTLARLRDDAEAFQRQLLAAVQQYTLVLFPASALLAALAPVLIAPLLGHHWLQFRGLSLVLSLLAGYAAIRTTLAIFFEAYKSIGKPWIIWAYSSIRLILMIPAMIVGAQHGILGLAVAYLPIQALEIPISVGLASRYLMVSPRALWHAAWAPILATLLMAALAVLGEWLLFDRLHIHALVTLFICLCIAVPAYVGAILLLDRRILHKTGRILVSGL